MHVIQSKIRFTENEWTQSYQKNKNHGTNIGLSFYPHISIIYNHEYFSLIKMPKSGFKQYEQEHTNFGRLFG